MNPGEPQKTLPPFLLKDPDFPHLFEAYGGPVRLQRKAVGLSPRKEAVLGLVVLGKVTLDPEDYRIALRLAIRLSRKRPKQFIPALKKLASGFEAAPSGPLRMAEILFAFGPGLLAPEDRHAVALRLYHALSYADLRDAWRSGLRGWGNALSGDVPQLLRQGLSAPANDSERRLKALFLENALRQPASLALLRVLTEALDDTFPEIRVLRRNLGRAPGPGETEAAVRSSSLRIAVAVSGEMRGWQAALPSWQALFPPSCSVTCVLSTWSRTRLCPDPRFAHRAFPKPFRMAYEAIARELGEPELYDRYPALTRPFRSSRAVDPAGLAAAYRTPHVEVEDPDAPPFAGMSNSERMYYKLRRADALVSGTGKTFDLVIRLRPDIPLRAAGWDPACLLAEAIENRCIYTAVGRGDSPTFAHEIDDQVAVGPPDLMAIYAGTHAAQQDQTLTALPGWPQAFTPHRNLAEHTLRKGIAVRSWPGVRFGPLADMQPPEPVALLERLESDASGRWDAWDRRLQQALQRSI